MFSGPTKKAAEDQRIATGKTATILSRLDGLRRSEMLPHDSRIFPGFHGLVMIVENGRRVVKTMCYQCRPAGKPALYDRKYPGTYNASRDNFKGFWKGQFGVSHGIMVTNTSYENVSRHTMEGRAVGEGEAAEFPGRQGAKAVADHRAAIEECRRDEGTAPGLVCSGREDRISPIPTITDFLGSAAEVMAAVAALWIVLRILDLASGGPTQRREHAVVISNSKRRKT